MKHKKNNGPNFHIIDWIDVLSIILLLALGIFAAVCFTLRGKGII